MTLLKDYVDRDVVERLGSAVASADPGFAQERFVQDATDGLGALELKARIDHIASALGRHLSPDFPSAALVMSKAVERASLDGWTAWPVNAWIERAGGDHPVESIALIELVTGRASSEFAVRPFIDAHPEQMAAVLRRWARSEDPHLRRLASEGSRPRLPWAPRLAVAEQDPAWALYVLDALREDPSPDVRRSVANHLNDISKQDAQTAVSIAARWQREGGEHVESLIRRGLRTLIKQGHRQALELVGADTSSTIEISDLVLPSKRLRLGAVLQFSCRVTNTGKKPASVVVDYAIHFVKANGSTTRKVFKLRTLVLEAGQAVSLSRRLPLQPITTRRYYSGRHLLEIQCNGTVGASAEFELEVPATSARLMPAAAMPTVAAGARMQR